MLKNRANLRLISRVGNHLLVKGWPFEYNFEEGFHEGPSRHAGH